MEVHTLCFLKPRLENFEHYFTRDERNCVVVWAFFGIAFLWDWNENWPFPVLWPLLSFPNLLAYWVQHFQVSFFRIWYSSTGIPSPPLALFISITWLHIPGCLALREWSHPWLSGLWRSFLYSSSMYSCHPFLISSASVRSIQFLSFIEPIFAWKVPLVTLIFLEAISSLSHSIVFLYFFAPGHWGRLSHLSLLFFGTLHSNG